MKVIEMSNGSQIIIDEFAEDVYEMFVFCLHNDNVPFDEYDYTKRKKKKYNYQQHNTSKKPRKGM